MGDYTNQGDKKSCKVDGIFRVKSSDVVALRTLCILYKFQHER
jgi:hypothetical protein